MDFELSDTQRERRRELLAAASDRFGTRGGPLAREDWAAAAKLGMVGLCLPPEHGGGGLGALDTALALEAFGQACPDTGLAFAIAAHLLACAVPVRDFAAPSVRAELLTGLAGGELIAGNAMTEREAGSDVGRLAVTARREGDRYVMNGEKTFVSNAAVADLFVTYAVTDPDAGFLGLSAFAVPRALPGITVGEPYRKLGLDGAPASWVRFEDCPIPAEYLLGEEGQGAAIFQHSMGWERGCLFGLYVGQMQRELDRCVRRARTRRQFGHPIGDFQAVSHRIAGMRLRLESARLLLYRACWLMDQDREHVEAVALSKVAVSEAAVANALDAVRVFGADGCLVDVGVEQQLRDAVPAVIFSGTSDIQRELIAREAGL
ncbi:MAG TPA: acyl-CoA dehydrogenase family protein [Actinospica sp.]|nr:acyl-CoA dehydrogenase family protein [Actinospica sp.]